MKKNENKKKNGEIQLKKSNYLNKITFLGGIREIGKNCFFINNQEQILIVDLGISFTNFSSKVSYVKVPNLEILIKNKYKIKGIILTHGHEDHIGGLEFFFRKLNMPLKMVTGKFTTALLKRKLGKLFKEKSWNLDNYLIEVKGRDKITLGCFDVQFFNITHSIPDALLTFIKTPNFKIVHTGDYKFDLSNPYQHDTDFYSLSKLGEEGIDLLLSDSTNANKEGFSNTETNIYNNFNKIFILHKEKRIIVLMFSSNLSRIISIIKLAIKFKRKIVVAGSSLSRNINIALALKYFSFKNNFFLSINKVNSVPPSSVVILCSGVQGETNASLYKIVHHNHKFIKISRSDLYIFSARSIPGNEKKIAVCKNAILKYDASIFTDKLDIHASGHGYRSDSRLMFKLIKPKFFIPVHGEYHHLVAHLSLALEMNILRKNILILKNGDTIGISKLEMKIVDQKENNGIILNNYLEEISEKNILERGIISNFGIIFINLVFVDRKLVIVNFLRKGIDKKKIFFTNFDLKIKFFFSKRDKISKENLLKFKKELKILSNKYLNNYFNNDEFPLVNFNFSFLISNEKM